MRPFIDHCFFLNTPAFHLLCCLLISTTDWKAGFIFCQFFSKDSALPQKYYRHSAAHTPIPGWDSS